jgi:peptide/nickel transport system permease protein
MLAGAQVSFEVAILATIFGLVIGVFMGMLAGYYGGAVDTLVSRATEMVMALPLLLFAIALSFMIGTRLNSYTFFGVFEPGVVTLVLVITLFSWYYPARIVRAQVLSLREKEFVEAARMVGASNFRILRSHLLPHLTGTIIVYSTLTVATNILLEAGLSFLGVGIPQGVPSWGNLINDAVSYYFTLPALMIWPGLGILFATLAFNLLGDGLRDAIDPRGAR